MNEENAIKGNEDKPLFVLKYVLRYKFIKVFFLYVPFTVFLFSIAVILSGSKNHFIRVIGPLFFIPAVLSGMFIIYITLLTKEIRLYGDRAVMILYLVGKREIMFKEASLTIKEELWRTQKVFFNPGRNTFHSLVNGYRRGIYIDDTLADKEDVREFNSIIEGITGKQINDLKKIPTTINMEK